MLHEEENEAQFSSVKNFLITSLVSGAFAGAVCDLVLFPLDTLKTRLQSQHGFVQSGGFNKLYHGVVPVLIGAAPAASVFFLTYDGLKEAAQPYIGQKYHFLIHLTAASFAEAVACVVRVPVEVLKQRKQALLEDNNKLGLRMLYRGYGSTVLRDVPFGLIQMPLWEQFKYYYKMSTHRECTPFEGAVCGAASVAISAAITTPLDVAKTRIMLSNTAAEKEEVKISTMLKQVHRSCGVQGLFAGFTPRVTAFTIGGFIFFGVYEHVRTICIDILEDKPESKT